MRALRMSCACVMCVVRVRRVCASCACCKCVVCMLRVRCVCAACASCACCVCVVCVACVLHVRAACSCCVCACCSSDRSSCGLPSTEVSLGMPSASAHSATIAARVSFRSALMPHVSASRRAASWSARILARSVFSSALLPRIRCHCPKSRSAATKRALRLKAAAAAIPTTEIVDAAELLRLRDK